ncbi:unnamed protein product, partial [Pylaiella littoralis]
RSTSYGRYFPSLFIFKKLLSRGSLYSPSLASYSTLNRHRENQAVKIVGIVSTSSVSTRAFQTIAHTPVTSGLAAMLCCGADAKVADRKRSNALSRS